MKGAGPESSNIAGWNTGAVIGVVIIIVVLVIIVIAVAIAIFVFVHKKYHKQYAISDDHG